MTKKVVPMIHVPDVQATVDWYRDIGFKIIETFGHEGEGLSFAILSFGASEVMFNEGGRTSTQRRREVDLYVYTDNVEEVYQNLKERVDVVEGVHDTFYGMRELIIRDLNRFWITFGQQSAYGKLLEGISEGKPDLVSAVLERGELKPESLTSALVAATGNASQSPEIIELLKRAGAVPPLELDEGILQAYAGKYKSEAGNEVAMTLTDGNLFAEPGGQQRLRLIAIDGTTFRPLAFDRVTVRFKVEDGKTTGFVLQDGTSTREHKRIEGS